VIAQLFVKGKAKIESGVILCQRNMQIWFPNSLRVVKEGMAIVYANVRFINTAGGGGAVTVAAYAARAKFDNEVTGQSWDYSGRADDHVSTDILLPSGAPASFADPAVLWNAAERAELLKDGSAFRHNAQLAKEIELALPKELDDAGRRELATEFVNEMFVEHGVAAQLSIHKPHGQGVNHHAHVLVTVRYVNEAGLGKKARELEPAVRWGKIVEKSDVHLKWTAFQNAYFERHGLPFRVDAIAPVPGVHLGAAAHMGQTANEAANEKARGATRALVLDNPEVILDQITKTSATFDMADVARAANKWTDTPEEFRQVFETVKASARLVRLTPESIAENGRTIPARYTTRDVADIEATMVRQSRDLSQTKSFAVSPDLITDAIAGFETEKGFALSEEQRAAVAHITGQGQMSSVVGLAGTGKSVMLDAARRAWEADGYTVQGAALAGIAVENLGGSGIEACRTLASWEHAWSRREAAEAMSMGRVTEAGRDAYRAHLEYRAENGSAAQAIEARRYMHELNIGVRSPELDAKMKRWATAQLNKLPPGLNRKTVLVLDEAGMVGARQLAALVERVQQAGAKLVVIGDWQQLQSIEAGAAFRVISERIGFAELLGIRRQQEAWMQDATRSLAAGKAGDALASYNNAGAIHTGIQFDKTSFIGDLEKSAGPLSGDDAARVLTIAHYIEARRAAGAIMAEGQSRADRETVFADFGPWKTQRDSAALEISRDIEAFKPWLHQFGIDGSKLSADILVASGATRAEANERAEKHAQDLGILEIGRDGELTKPDMRSGARTAMAAAWHNAAKEGETRLMLAHTNKDVDALNAVARDYLRSAGKLTGEAIIVATEKGRKEFQAGDRIVFLNRDRTLGVRNGQLGTVAAIERAGGSDPVLVVQIDNKKAGDLIRVDSATYAAFDHGNAITVHKSQGSTVDRTFVLSSTGLDRHLAYVSMSRHRLTTEVFAGAAEAPTLATLGATMSRANSQDSSLDYGKTGASSFTSAVLQGLADRLDTAWGDLNAAVKGVFSRAGAVAPIPPPTSQSAIISSAPAQTNKATAQATPPQREQQPAQQQSTLADPLPGQKPAEGEFAAMAAPDAVSSATIIDDFKQKQQAWQEAFTTSLFDPSAKAQVADLREHLAQLSAQIGDNPQLSEAAREAGILDSIHLLRTPTTEEEAERERERDADRGLDR
jgi:ATP-dependent exoDNAse (exonuclease V) alpha subunit